MARNILFWVAILVAASVTPDLLMKVAIACNYNNCNAGCHGYGQYQPDSTTCYTIHDGVQYWNTTVVHTGATNPGGVWGTPGNNNIIKKKWDMCCKSCLGNYNAAAPQEITETSFNADTSWPENANMCFNP